MMDQIGRIFGLYDDVGLPHLEHTLQRFPRLIILGPGPAFWAEIGRLRTPADRSVVLLPVGPVEADFRIILLKKKELSQSFFGDMKTSMAISPPNVDGMH